MRKIKRNPQVISDEVEGTRMLCHTGFVEFFRLNATGAQIWDICEGKDIDSVVNHLIEIYPGVKHDYLIQEAQLFVSSMEAAGLVEMQEPASTGYSS